MYLRSTAQKRKDGSVIRYLQLAHNVWDPVAKRSRAEIVYSFGREDAANRAALERLVASISRFLRLRPLLRPLLVRTSPSSSPGPWVVPYVLDALWQRLGIDATLRRLLRGRRLDVRAERVLFALVANRALCPSSKLAASRWVSEDVEIPGLPKTSDDACYRAMDFLLEIAPALEKEVFHQVANLLNLEVDLLFFDTTSTYFSRDEADEPVYRDGRGRPLPESGGIRLDEDQDGSSCGFRTYGKSKDHRDDLPQIVIGMAVTREGIPVRVWSWPGNTADSSLIRQVKEDLRDWTLSRVVWVADRGFSSAQNRRYLRQGDHHYIIGERLRSGSALSRAALSRAGRYQKVRENLKVKEVRIAEGERFVICFNPEAAERDAAVRVRLVARLEEMIADSDRLSPTKRAELRGSSPPSPVLTATCA